MLERTLALIVKTLISPEPLSAPPTESCLDAMTSSYLLVDRYFVTVLNDRCHIPCTWIEDKHRALMDESWHEEIKRLPIA